MKLNIKLILIGLIVAASVGGYFGVNLYNTFLAPNVSGNQKYLYVKTGYVLEDLITDLRYKNPLKDIGSFWKAADKMGLKGKLKPGRYLLTPGLNNRTLINMLKSGNQEPVDLKFHNLRLKENFAAYLGKNLETDSLHFVKLLDSADFVGKFGFNTNNIYTMFIPNTYQIYWNISGEDFFKKMNAQYLKFWNSERLAKAKALNLSPQEVSILASIVDGEALYDKEMPIIAGLYLNRLSKGILLQADPTVIFANGDFTVKRVTGPLLRKESPYNTYKYAGLPPGPISMPSINAIDAVLNRDHNNYIYMCAKEDFSGYHNFAADKAQHEINAKKYREALDKRNIYR